MDWFEQAKETIANGATTLWLTDHHLGDDGAEKLAALLPGSRVECLELGNTHIGLKGLTALARALPTTNVKTLSLFSNHVGAEEIKILAAALPQTKITDLDLAQNRIGPAGAHILAEVLPDTAIETLDLSSTAIGREGFETLADALPHLRTSIRGLDDNTSSHHDQMRSIYGVDAEQEPLLAPETPPQLPTTRIEDTVLDRQRRAALKDPGQGI